MPAMAEENTAVLRSIDELTLLRAVPVFGRLTLLAASLGVQAFERGQTIFHQGDRGDTLYLVARGQVRVYHPLAWGHELSVAIFRAGDVFGELALLDDQPRSASAAAMLPTITLTLGRSAFQQIIQAHPTIAQAMLMELASRLRTSTNYATHLANPAAYQRVGWLVLDLAQRYGVSGVDGTRIDLQLTQDDLASMFGVTRETVNRVLARLRDQGLVAFEHGQILVLDCAQLERALVQAEAQPARRFGTQQTTECSTDLCHRCDSDHSAEGGVGGRVGAIAAANEQARLLQAIASKDESDHLGRRSQ